MTFLFHVANLWLPEQLPLLYESPEQLLGQVLMLTLAIAYLLGMLPIAQRRSLRHATAIYELRLINDHPDTWLRPVPWRPLLIGALLGVIYYVLLNLPTQWSYWTNLANRQIVGLVVGQTLLWIVIGVALAYRLSTAARLDQAGLAATVDIYRSSKLVALARNGVDDALLIAGALAISVLQSLDAQFRLFNYLSAVLVTFPATAYLLYRPMHNVHRRLSQQKAAYLAEIDRRLNEQSNGPGPHPELEGIMQHRDRLRQSHTWPFDLGLVYRLLFYVVIPPLAWLGAALVEYALESAIS
jgi:hypothetical protein